LERPPERAHLVPRPELSDRLQAGLAGKLTLVSAPAGFGKTTLVSAWLARSGQRSTWLALDEDDNDPARFLTYLVTALQQVEVGLGQDVLAVLGTPRPPPLTPLLTDLLNEVATLEELLILVLDDYHVIHTPEIHEALAFILEHQPRRLHVVVITREDPMLPLPRLRVRGEITEIYAGDLRFSGAEATAFLNEIMGLGLAADGVTALEARTEGWIAGLQLAALALEHEADKKGFIETFAAYRAGQSLPGAPRP
jgi:LuxR family maltose regulon positive regulatory protein